MQFTTIRLVPYDYSELIAVLIENPTERCLIPELFHNSPSYDVWLTAAVNKWRVGIAKRYKDEDEAYMWVRGTPDAKYAHHKTLDNIIIHERIVIPFLRFLVVNRLGDTRRSYKRLHVYACSTALLEQSFSLMISR